MTPFPSSPPAHAPPAEPPQRRVADSLARLYLRDLEAYAAGDLRRFVRMVGGTAFGEVTQYGSADLWLDILGRLVEGDRLTPALAAAVDAFLDRYELPAAAQVEHALAVQELGYELEDPDADEAAGDLPQRPYVPPWQRGARRRRRPAQGG